MLKDLKTFIFLVGDDLQGRGVQRRSAEVGRVCYYKMVTGRNTIYLAFHLTRDGKVADLDFSID